jgi:sulfatase modifying factor 1
MTMRAALGAVVAVTLAWAAGGCDVAVPDAPAADTSASPPASTPAHVLDEVPVAPSIPVTASAAPSASGSAAKASAPVWAITAGSGSASATSAASDAPAPPPPPPCPADMVLVGRTCVDAFEAYLVEVAADGTKKIHPHTERPAKDAKYMAANEAGRFPQGYISRVESLAACKAADKRLCSKREWQSACRGKGGARWPYGHSGVREKCNTGKQHLLTLEFAKVGRGLKYDEHFNSPILNAKPGWLAESGKYDGCVSDKGIHDMVGNLHEWVSGTVDQDLVDAMALEDVVRSNEQPWVTGNGIFMGGFYSTTTEHGAGCDFITIAHEPSYHDYSTGFRCCKDADLPKPPPKKR